MAELLVQLLILFFKTIFLFHAASILRCSIIEDYSNALWQGSDINTVTSSL